MQPIVGMMTVVVLRNSCHSFYPAIPLNVSDSGTRVGKCLVDSMSPRHLVNSFYVLLNPLALNAVGML